MWEREWEKSEEVVGVVAAVRGLFEVETDSFVVSLTPARKGERLAMGM